MEMIFILSKANLFLSEWIYPYVNQWNRLSLFLSLSSNSFEYTQLVLVLVIPFSSYLVALFNLVNTLILHHNTKKIALIISALLIYLD